VRYEVRGLVRRNLHLVIAGVSLGLVALAYGCAHSGHHELVPFASDGCSSFPDGTREDPERWKRCCVEHDIAYWLGGTRDDRLRADDALKACVAEVESESLARTMWLGVRAGGSPYLPTRYRWSYGWPFTRGYRAVSEEEARRASSLIDSELGLQRTVALEIE
jgi:hypothetical protein